MFRYYKGDPNAYILAFRQGRMVRRGAGITFWYMPMHTTVARVSTVAMDAPFLIRETTRDYQEISVQGNLTYRIADPELAAARLDFTVQAGGNYRSDDPTRLVERITNAAQARMRGVVRTWTLEETLDRAQELATTTAERLAAEASLAKLGVEVEGLHVIGVQAEPEVQRALEAPYREAVNRRADDAIFERRAAALDQERALKQHEMDTSIQVEDARRELVTRQAQNDLTLAEAEAQADRLKLEPYAEVPVQALVALALKEWAANPAGIGQLNITPDMLTQFAGWMGSGQGAVGAPGAKA